MQSVGIWGLREEARKSWDHVVSDEIVYLAEPIDLDLEVIGFTEKYLNRKLWLEVHVTCPREAQRERHFQMIWEASRIQAKPLPSWDVEPNRNFIVGAGRGAVLVERPQFIELPEGVILKSLASEIRLKPIEDACHCGWKQIAPSVVSPRIAEYGEVDVPLFAAFESPSTVKVGQSPTQLIETGSQATHEIAEQHRDDFRCGCELNPEDMKWQKKN